MNSIVLEFSALEDKVIDNTGMYSLEIHKKISEMLEIENKNELRVSNIFGEFFNETIQLEKNKKYKIRVITKTQEKFLKLRDQLFQIAINKEKIVIENGVFQLAGIITKNDTWCGEYDIEKEIKSLDVDIVNFSAKINLKIINPILKDGKSIFGLEKILEIILKNVKNDTNLVIEGIKENILNSITVKKEFYREKKVNLLNSKVKKIYLGDIEVVLRGYYGNLFLFFLKYVKYAGIGEFREYGFGEMIIKNEILNIKIQTKRNIYNERFGKAKRLFSG